MVILARINHQLNESLGGLKKRLRKHKHLAITKYLRPEQIVFMDAASRDDSLSQLSQLLAEKGVLEDREAFYSAVIDRENLVSTGIGMGIAIPHAKISTHDAFFMAVGIQTGQGLEWDSLDANPVRVIFMIGGPDNQQMEYLKILSSLTMAVKNENFRKKLFQATTAQEVIELFEGY